MIEKPVHPGPLASLKEIQTYQTRLLEYHKWLAENPMKYKREKRG